MAEARQESEGGVQAAQPNTPTIESRLETRQQRAERRMREARNGPLIALRLAVHDWRNRHIQALGAAISRYDKHGEFGIQEIEQAYARFRDAIDAEIVAMTAIR